MNRRNLTILKTPQSILFFIIVCTILNSCERYQAHTGSLQFSGTNRKVLDSLINMDSLQSAAIYLDSVNSKIEPSLIADKYTYYNYKLQLSSKNIDDKRFSLDSQLVYVDSMILIIEENHMEKSMQSELADAYNKKISICTAWGLYEEAAEVIAKTILLNLEMGDTCATAENTKVLASISFNQLKFAEAIELYKKALKLEAYCPKDSRQYYRMQLYLSDLALACSKNMENDSSLKYYFEAEKYILNNKYLANDTMFPYEALVNVYANLGQVYRRFNDQLEISEYYNLKAYDIASRILKDTGTMAQINLFLADTYLMQGKLDKAEQKLKEGLRQSSYFYLEDHRLSNRIGKDLSLARKDFKLYSDYAEKYFFYMDSTHRFETLLRTKNPNAQYERLDKRRQIELLSKVNQIQKAKTISAIVFIGMLLILLVTSIYYFRKNSKMLKNEAHLYKNLLAKEEDLKNALLEKNIQEKLKKDEELYFQEIRLKMKNAALLFEQRQKISMDLHDNLNSSIAALSFYLEDLLTKEDPLDKRDLESIKEEVNTIYQNTRNYTHHLNFNTKYEVHNLLDMLEEVREKMLKNNLAILNIDINKDNFRHLLTNQQQDQLYYIINEALVNIFKHAKAENISVAIGYDNDQCLFKIKDNGVGFDVLEEKKSGLGLYSMKARAVQLGGSIRIESSNEGTIVEGQFPLSK